MLIERCRYAYRTVIVLLIKAHQGSLPDTAQRYVVVKNKEGMSHANIVTKEPAKSIALPIQETPTCISDQ